MTAPNPSGISLYTSGEFNSTLINMDVAAFFPTPATNAKIFCYAQVSGTIIGWVIAADQSGSCVVDIWKVALLSGPPTVSNTITGTYLPTLSSAAAAVGGSPPGQTPNASSMTTLGWGNVLVNAGDLFIFNMNSFSTVTKAFVGLVIKTGS